MSLRIKKALRKLVAYSPDDVDFKIRLNANEAPFDFGINEIRSLKNSKAKKYLKFNSVNRYPDAKQIDLRNLIAKHYKVNQNQVALFNGSDELILNLLLSLTGKSESVLTFKPSFSMYKILTQSLGMKCLEVPLTQNYDIDLPKTLEILSEADPDLIFIASPNNPTSNSFSKEKIFKILNKAKGLVVIDEAYSEYASFSFMKSLKKYKNLVIMKTMSKIGFASLRLGFLIANKEVVNIVNKVRLPYNVSTLSQLIAQDYFIHIKEYKEQIQNVINERIKLTEKLEGYKQIKITDSDSNFLFIEYFKTTKLCNFLKTKNINIKTFTDKKLINYFRVTIGTEKENNALLKYLSIFFKKNS